jgi:prepilin peptidase dependent protein B
MQLKPTQRGLSLVEMLVGVAVGMFLIAGASTMFVANLGSSRELLVEARLNQDLRTATDLVSRDLRRAAYWSNAVAGTIALPGGLATTANPYAAIASAAGRVEYRFARDALDAVSESEQFGFRIEPVGGIGTLQMKFSAASAVAADWQPLTDPAAVNVTNFTITPTETVISAGNACARPCPASVAGCPTLTIRQYDITITGAAPNDPALVRTLRTRTRLRNDLVAGVCPP